MKPRTPEPFGFTRARKDFRSALVMLPERALADSSVVFTRQTLAALRGLRRVDRVQFAATMARLSAIPRFPIMRLRHSLKIAVEARFPNARELIAGYLATAPWVSSGLPGPTPMDVCSVFETQVTLAVRRFAATILRDLGWRPIRMRLGERGEDKRRALVTFYVRGER